MKLRKGKTKSILESSIDAALLAVEVYNKPRTTFRSQNFISMMIIAWTRLFHAYFHQSIGDRFYYKKKNGRYEQIDGERKCWDLTTCIKEYGKLSNPIVANINFFIPLRNKIEHRPIIQGELDNTIFGECQSLLYNYETTLIEFFGQEYALHESLVFALQFSHMRVAEQQKANKKALAAEVKELYDYVQKYRDSLPDNVFDAQEYSVKLIQIPKIANTNRSDLSVEFVNWNQLSEEDKDSYDKLLGIIKDKVIKKEAVNVGRLKPSEVIKRVNAKSAIKITQYDHMRLYKVFKIRPVKGIGDYDPFDTNTDFCHYDEAHDDYVYQESWCDFIVNALNSGKLTKDIYAEAYKNKSTLEVIDFL